MLAWPVLLIFVIFDTTQGVSAAVLRGTGMQKTGSIVTSIAYWVLGIPIALVSIYKFDQGIRGLWYGPTVAVLFNTCAYQWMISKIDWPVLIEKMREMRKKDKNQAARGGG